MEFAGHFGLSNKVTPADSTVLAEQCKCFQIGAEMEICDVCNSEIFDHAGELYTAEDFRRIVARGFIPPSGVIEMLRSLPGHGTSTYEQLVYAWRRGIVAQSINDWHICPDCAKTAMAYKASLQEKPALVNPEDLPRLREIVLSTATSTKKDPKRMTLILLLAAVLAGWSIKEWNDSGDSVVWAVILGIVAFLVVVLALMQRTGRCPNCGASISFSQFTLCTCKSCMSESSVMNGRLALVGTGFVGDSPVFEAYLNDLRPPDLWQWPWPSKCSTCGSPSTKTINLEVTTATLMLMKKTRYRYTFLFEGCKQHGEMSVRYEDGHENMKMARLQFRSFDYWKAFMAMNLKTDPPQIASLIPRV